MKKTFVGIAALIIFVTINGLQGYCSEKKNLDLFVPRQQAHAPPLGGRASPAGDNFETVFVIGLAAGVSYYLYDFYQSYSSTNSSWWRNLKIIRVGFFCLGFATAFYIFVRIHQSKNCGLLEDKWDFRACIRFLDFICEGEVNNKDAALKPDTKEG